MDDMIADDISTNTLRFGSGCTSESPEAGAPDARLGDTRPDDSHRGVEQHRLSRQGRLHSCNILRTPFNVNTISTEIIVMPAGMLYMDKHGFSHRLKRVFRSTIR